MVIAPTPPFAPADARLDEAQWQCANNEGWPDRECARWAWPPGVVAPVVALAATSNVVDMHAWRVTRSPAQRASTG